MELRAKSYTEKNPNLFVKLFKSYSYTEKILFIIISSIFLFSGLTLLLTYNESILETVPLRGGTITEGVIGNPRFVNPILATSDTDNDLVALVYSGLMRVDTDGRLIPDLASGYQVSEDGLTYTFTLRDNAVFHDGTPVTGSDVVFTIEKIKIDTIKSPQRGNWDSITVTSDDERTVSFNLPNPFPAFLLNTTLGILPSHIWQEVADEEFPFAERNINPIGSGPYKISSIERNSAGIAQNYTLTSFSQFTLGAPYIDTLVVKFYKSELSLIEALQNNTITSAGGISPQNAQGLAQADKRIITYPLPRVFGVFFNQNQAQLFASQNVREALETSINKSLLVENILQGYGNITDAPIPPAFGIFPNETATTTESFSPEDAEALLARAGFEETNEDGILVDEDGQQLRFTLATADVPELVAMAQSLQKQWKDVGVTVRVDTFSPRDFTQNIIRTRSYDAILFGEVVGRDIDLYPFWHSSQRNDPGLNIATYANIDADAALEEARLLQDETLKAEALGIVVREITNDRPAIFLYNPAYIYTIPADIEGVDTGILVTASERFNDVHKWYKDTDRVWIFFNQ